MVRHVLEIKEPRRLHFHEHVCLYVAQQLFWGLPNIGESDIHYVLREMLPMFQVTFEEIEGPEDAIDYPAVIIADGHYVAWTGADGFIECKTGDKLELLPRPAMATISIDVHAVFFRMSSLYEKFELDNANLTTN